MAQGTAAEEQRGQPRTTRQGLALLLPTREATSNTSPRQNDTDMGLPPFAAAVWFGTFSQRLGSDRAAWVCLILCQNTVLRDHLLFETQSLIVLSGHGQEEINYAQDLNMLLPRLTNTNRHFSLLTLIWKARENISSIFIQPQLLPWTPEPKPLQAPHKFGFAVWFVAVVWFLFVCVGFLTNNETNKKPHRTTKTNQTKNTHTQNQNQTNTPLNTITTHRKKHYLSQRGKQQTFTLDQKCSISAQIRKVQRHTWGNVKSHKNEFCVLTSMLLVVQSW